MPSLRQMVAEAPDEMRELVRWFVAENLDDPAGIEAWTDRVVSAIAATRAGHPWSRNLRELKNYTERYLLTEGRVSQPEVTAPAIPPVAAEETEPSSSSPPSSGLLGPRAMEGSISVHELIRAYVTRVHVLTRQNQTETARRTGLNWRTVGQLIDPVRLLRWLQQAAKKPGSK
jgi:DNA-binding NtrC family response regulator